MPTLNPDDPTTVAACTDSALSSDVNAAIDCYQPTLHFGPTARNLYYARTGNPLIEITAAEISRRLALPDTDVEQMVGPLICEVVRGSGGTTTNTVRVNGEDFDTATTSVYDVTFQDTSDANHEMMRRTQAGRVKGHWYGVDQNNKWRGGQNGMCGGMATLKLRENSSNGETDLQTFTGTLTGTGKYDDARIASPIPCVFGGK